MMSKLIKIKKKERVTHNTPFLFFVFNYHMYVILHWDLVTLNLWKN